MSDEPKKLKPLTRDQLENWRRVLAIQYGLEALNFSDAEIERLRTNFQNAADAGNLNQEEKE